MILETGTAANGTKSTYLFDAYVTQYGGHLWTVDNDPKTSANVKDKMGPNTTVLTMDSVEFLTQWVNDHPGVAADIVYLDSWDVDWANPSPSGIHGLNEYTAILPALGSGSLLLIDDTPNPSEEFFDEYPEYYQSIGKAFYTQGRILGKGMYVMEHIQAQLLDHWYQLLYAFP